MEMTEYVYPELFCLIPMLLVLGKLLKAAEFFADRLIPAVLGGTGILIAACYIVGKEQVCTASTLASATVQGILCAGAAVYGHQLVKQWGRKERGKEESDE